MSKPIDCKHEVEEMSTLSSSTINHEIQSFLIQEHSFSAGRIDPTNTCHDGKPLNCIDCDRIPEERVSCQNCEATYCKPHFGVRLFKTRPCKKCNSPLELPPAAQNGETPPLISIYCSVSANSEDHCYHTTTEASKIHMEKTHSEEDRVELGINIEKSVDYSKKSYKGLHLFKQVSLSVVASQGGLELKESSEEDGSLLIHDAESDISTTDELHSDTPPRKIGSRNRSFIPSLFLQIFSTLLLVSLLTTNIIVVPETVLQLGRWVERSEPRLVLAPICFSEHQCDLFEIPDVVSKELDESSI